MALTGQSFAAAEARSEESAALFHSLSSLPAQTVSARSQPHPGARSSAAPGAGSAGRAGPAPGAGPRAGAAPQSVRVSPRRLRMKAAMSR